MYTTFVIDVCIIIYNHRLFVQTLMYTTFVIDESLILSPIAMYNNVLFFLAPCFTILVIGSNLE
jgi:hypothetical protein